MILVVAAALAALVLLSSQAPGEEVVVLPGREGHVGMVVVERGAARHVLNKAYAASTSGEPDVVQASAEHVRSVYGNALNALPARPRSFLLYFEAGKDELTRDSQAELEKILAELRRRPVPDVGVIGHTDTVGELESNDLLSAQRAERVRTFLISVGIREDRIKATGRGERELLIPTADNVDEPRNRRVEINVR